MFAFGQSLFNQVLKTLGAPGLCVVLCFALVVGGVVTTAIVNQADGRKPVVEWVNKVGVVPFFPAFRASRPLVADL